MLDKFVINGGIPLKGSVNISGSKNSAVAVIPACILVDGPCTIENISDITDVKVLKNILIQMGAKIPVDDNGTIVVDASTVETFEAPYDLVKSLRASYYLLGALLGKYKKAEVPLPGGCDFGDRPIDQHIKGFEALGAKVSIEHGIVKVAADRLIGTQIYLDVVSVGATINLIFAAVKAEGLTVIENAAKEPHIVDVANFLNAMGANIKGAGTDVIKIRGKELLPGNATHTIIPDQIEAGTYMIAAAATLGDITVKNIIPKHMESLTAKLLEMNVKVIEGEDDIRVIGTDKLTRVHLKTLPYPGFPTDLHPPMAVLLALANGTSTITEGIWDLRFQYVDELKRMGLNIKVDGRMAIIEGNGKLSGAPVKAMDLRAGAALVIAGLAAEGRTELSNVHLIDRGYEYMQEKLMELGADISRA